MTAYDIGLAFGPVPPMTEAEGFWLTILGVVVAYGLLHGIAAAGQSVGFLSSHHKEIERASFGIGFIAIAPLLLTWGVKWPYLGGRPYLFIAGLAFLAWGISWYRIGVSRLKHQPRDAAHGPGGLVLIAIGVGFLFIFAKHWVRDWGGALGIFANAFVEAVGVFYLFHGVSRILLNRDRIDKRKSDTETVVGMDPQFGTSKFDE